jgi:hypothetical protein
MRSAGIEPLSSRWKRTVLTNCTINPYSFHKNFVIFIMVVVMMMIWMVVVMFVLSMTVVVVLVPLLEHSVSVHVL